MSAATSKMTSNTPYCPVPAVYRYPPPQRVNVPVGRQNLYDPYASYGQSTSGMYYPQAHQGFPALNFSFTPRLHSGPSETYMPQIAGGNPYSASDTESTLYPPTAICPYVSEAPGFQAPGLPPPPQLYQAPPQTTTLGTTTGDPYHAMNSPPTPSPPITPKYTSQYFQTPVDGFVLSVPSSQYHTSPFPQAKPSPQPVFSSSSAEKQLAPASLTEQYHTTTDTSGQQYT